MVDSEGCKPVLEGALQPSKVQKPDRRDFAFFLFPDNVYTHENSFTLGAHPDVWLQVVRAFCAIIKKDQRVGYTYQKLCRAGMELRV